MSATFTRTYHLLFLFILFSNISFSQQSKWILGNSQQTNSSSFYPVSTGNLAFYEVDFSGSNPSVTTRNLGNTINNILSMGTQDVIDNAVDSNGNVLFYLFSASLTPFNNFSGIASDTIYFVAPNASGLDQVFGKVPATNRVSSVIEHVLCPRPNHPGQYYFVYREKYGSINTDNLKYVVIDGLNQTVSTPITILTNEIIGEGFCVSPYNCELNNRWLFLTKQMTNGDVIVRRLECNNLGISSITDVATINITGNSSNVVVAGIEMNNQANKIAVCLFSAQGSNKSASVFDFNLSNGNLSNERNYITSTGRIVSCEFSPDGNRIYFLQGGGSTFPNVVYNCPVISSGSMSLNSSNQMTSILLDGSMAIEKATDDKIYLNKGHNQNSVYIISNANSATPTITSSSSPFFGTTTFRIGDGFPDPIDGENFIQSNIEVIDLSTMDDTICAGQQTSLTVSGANLFDWSDGFSSNNTTRVVSPNVSQTYVVTANQCGLFTSDSITIVVQSTPNIDVFGDTVICKNDSVLLIANGADNYFWNHSTVLSNDSIYLTPSSSLYYTVQGLTQNCLSETDSVYIEVREFDNTTIIGDTLICEGESTILFLSTTNNNALTYNWSNGITSDSVLISPLINTAYSVSVEDSIGCSFTDSILVTVFSQPVAEFIGNGTGCAPVEINFTNSSINATNYSWNFNDGTESSSSNPTHVFTAPGEYFVSLQASNQGGCLDTFIQSFPITVFDQAFSNFTVNFYDPVNSQKVILENSSSGGTDCSLDFGDGSFNYDCNWEILQHSYSHPGNYTITQIVTNSFGCSDTLQRTIVVSGASIFYVPNSFTPDGNEFNNSFGVVFSDHTNVSDFQLLIFNRWGELLFESYDPYSSWDGTYHNKLVIDGTYIWKLKFKTADKLDKEFSAHVNVLR